MTRNRLSQILLLSLTCSLQVVVGEDSLARMNPPTIILKFDDLTQQHPVLPRPFVKLKEILDERQLKASFGLICYSKWDDAISLAEATPEYLAWLKGILDEGNIELWFHGYDHTAHTVDGTLYSEFNGRGFDEQKRRFDEGLSIIKEQLGFYPKVFGPGGSMSKAPHINLHTMQVLSENPHIKGAFLDERTWGRYVRPEGKIVFFSVGGARMEKGTGNPDFEHFLRGYREHPERDYFVLQGHPYVWDDAKFEQVIRILDFLIEEGAVFVTPSEFIKMRRTQ